MTAGSDPDRVAQVTNHVTALHRNARIGQPARWQGHWIGDVKSESTVSQPIFLLQASPPF